MVGGRKNFHVEGGLWEGRSLEFKGEPWKSVVGGGIFCGDPLKIIFFYLSSARTPNVCLSV